MFEEIFFVVVVDVVVSANQIKNLYWSICLYKYCSVQLLNNQAIGFLSIIHTEWNIFSVCFSRKADLTEPPQLPPSAFCRGKFQIYTHRLFCHNSAGMWKGRDCVWEESRPNL